MTLPRYYRFGPFTVDTRKRRLLRAGAVVPLTPKAFDTLLVLVASGGEIVGKDDLIKRVWPDTFVSEDALTQNISVLRKALDDRRDRACIATAPRNGYRFVADVRSVWGDGPVGGRGTVAAGTVDPKGGALPLDSPYYVERRADDEVHRAIGRRESIVLLKGARQTGKTSLLARGLQQARDSGARVVVTDFQDLGSSDFESAKTLFLAVGDVIAEGLGSDRSARSTWDERDSANTNFGRYMRRDVLRASDPPVVWGIDEADRIFRCAFAGEVFGLFRAWHNKRSLDPGSPWGRLTIVIAYATEAHLFITDLNQSPFNVGRLVVLDDFTLDQIAELNRRHGSPIREAVGLSRFHALVGGQPFLAQVGLSELTRDTPLDTFEQIAALDEGPFGAHLRRTARMIEREAPLVEAVRQVLQGEPCPATTFYALRSAGVFGGDSASSARLRCPIYAAYLARHLT